MGSLSFNAITQTGTAIALDALTGIQDWSAWSDAATPPTPTDHRNGGGSTIAISLAGVANGYIGYAGGAEVRQIAWTNGTNTGTSNFTACQYANNGTNVNAGFTLTFPASTTTRRAYIYCGPYNCIGGVSASLSDGSATSISDTTSLTGSSGVINDSTVIIDYAANSAGQTLTVTIFYAASGGFSGGFMTIQAAAVSVISSGSTITPTSGAAAMAGAAVALALSMGGTQGAAAFQGYAPTLSGTSPHIASSPGAVAFTGLSPPLAMSAVIPVGSGSFTGQAPTLSSSSSRILTPASGTLSLAGPSALQGFTNTPGVGSLTATGQTPNVSLNTSGGALTPSQADMAFVGYVSPQILTLPPVPAGSASFQGYAPSTGGNAIIAPTTAALAFQGYVPLFGLQAQAGSVSFQGQTPTLATGGGTTSAAGTFSFGGLAPIVTSQVALNTSVGSGTFTGQAPTLVRSNFTVPGSLSFVGYSPALQGASNQYRFGMLFPLDANGRVPTVPVAQGQTPYTSVSGVLLDAIGRVVVGQGIEPPVYHDGLEMDTGYLVITTTPIAPISTESGLQYDSTGALYVVYGGTTSTWQNGLPFDSNGALVVD